APERNFASTSGPGCGRMRADLGGVVYPFLGPQACTQPLELPASSGSRGSRSGRAHGTPGRIPEWREHASMMGVLNRGTSGTDQYWGNRIGPILVIPRGHVSGLENKDFEKLAVPLLDGLYNFACWLSGDADEARDLVQETFVKSLKGFSS